jgi:hypothetical protein
MTENRLFSFAMQQRSNRKSGDRDGRWEGFETIGPEIENEVVIKCPWRARIFHGIMVSLGLGFVFLLGGAFVWYVLNGHVSFFFTRAKTAVAGWGQFTLGGILASIWVVKLVHRPQKQPKGF